MTMHSEILKDQEKVNCLNEDVRRAVKLLLTEIRENNYAGFVIDVKLADLAQRFDVSLDFIKTYFRWLLKSADSIMVFYNTDTYRFDRRTGNQFLPKNCLIVATISRKGALYFSRPELSEVKKDELLTVLQESLYMVEQWKTNALAILFDEVIVFLG